MLAKSLQRLRLPATRYLTAERRRNYTNYRITDRFIKALGIKPEKLSKRDMIALIELVKIFTPTPAITLSDALTNLNGGQLATITNEAYSDQNLLAFVGMVPTLRRKYLLEQDRKDGLTSLLLTTDEEIGHLYFNLSSRPVNSGTLARLRRSTTLSWGNVPSTFFLGFPGSGYSGGQPSIADPLTYPVELISDPPFTSLDKQYLVARSYDPDPATEKEFQLGEGNFVVISSAAAATQNDKLSVVSWLNSTTRQHVFDGRVSFSLMPDPTEDLLHLLAIGFGQHPFAAADFLNTTMGCAVFDTTLQTFIEALEYHSDKVRAGTDGFTDDDFARIAETLGQRAFPNATALQLRHAMFEMFNAVGGPALQWIRLIRDPSTTTPPSSKKITEMADGEK